MWWPVDFDHAVDLDCTIDLSLPVSLNAACLPRGVQPTIAALAWSWTSV
jgi:hypothetical protein